jgi:hypothetical protein
MKTTEKVEIILKGFFTGKEICISNKELTLYKTDHGQYSATFEHMEISWPLDFRVTLSGELGNKWKLIIRIGGAEIFKQSGQFLEKRWVTLTGSYLRDEVREMINYPGYALIHRI